MTVPPRTVLLDTSFVLALENRDDPFHAKAKEWDRRLLQDGSRQDSSGNARTLTS